MVVATRLRRGTVATEGAGRRGTNGRKGATR